MQDVLLLDQIEQAEALSKPVRIAVLRRLDEPHTCTEPGEALAAPAQKLYYHVKRLEEARLVEQVARRPVRGLVEALYRARARPYLAVARAGRTHRPAALRSRRPRAAARSGRGISDRCRPDGRRAR